MHKRFQQNFVRALGFIPWMLVFGLATTSGCGKVAQHPFISQLEQGGTKTATVEYFPSLNGDSGFPVNSKTDAQSAFETYLKSTPEVSRNRDWSSVQESRLFFFLRSESNDQAIVYVRKGQQVIRFFCPK